MDKIKLGVIFGGMSTEHDVSVTSGTSVIKNLNKEKYEIKPIYIDKEGNWFTYTKDISEITILEVGEEIQEKEKIENPIETLKMCDAIFPVLHGLYGEDGTIQGLLELLKKPYVGCKVLSSSICMDKAYSKILFAKAGIEQAKNIYVKKKQSQYYMVDKLMNEMPLNIEELSKKVKEELNYPVFVKPSNSGSSVGITKAHNEKEFIEAVQYASQLDRKILIEENINGREVECAVLGTDEIEASGVGEILPAEEFYTFDAKYKNAQSRVVIPAQIEKELEQKIQQTAKKAFKTVDGRGLSRVDFFIENNTNRIIINEINTMPGFTQISMYPKLWEAMGVSYSELLDKLIELATQE